MNTDIYEEIYGRFKGKIFLFYICGWIIITLLEVIVGLFFTELKWFPNYYRDRVFIPAAINGILALVTLILINNKKVKYVVKNYAVIISLLGTCLALSICHGYFLAILSVFIIPVLVATAFLDYKIFTFTIISSITGVVVSAIVNIFWERETVREGGLYVLGSTAIVILNVILAAIISVLILKLHQSRENALLQAQKENAKLSKENRVDGLTNLQNHTSFYMVLENKLSKARHDKRGFAIAVLDIDDFKNVNDTYGHAVGDEILKYVSESIVSVIGRMGVPFRYGGDEFAIIFNNPDPELNINALEKLRSMIADTDTLFSDGTIVTLSIGYYNIKEASMSAEDIFFKADQALYKAKYNGKNQVHADY